MNFLEKINVSPSKTIKQEQLSKLRGGAMEDVWYCRCGIAGSYTGVCFPVLANDSSEASDIADAICGESGNSCDDGGCPE